ncbi:MAG: DNA internalization-related competence protein ComEC/Rec2 [Ignavibacteriales bacterium]|nr:MAG: DNA internalization-related competence protein ComEC/Rec2 [Ignavibacteriales bacterium]
MKDYPLIKVAIFFIAGIISGRLISASVLPDYMFYCIFSFLSVIIFIIYLLNKKKTSAVQIISSFCFGIILIFLGIINYNLSLNDVKPFPFQKSKIADARMFGEISEIELNREFEIRFTVNTDSIIAGCQKFFLNHNFLCRVRDENMKNLNRIYSKLRVGNYISVAGTITKGREQRNPGEFDYQNYLEQKGITGILTSYNAEDLIVLDSAKTNFANIILSFRKSIDERISELHTPVAASLLKGLIVGDRSEISDETKTDFINTGVVHVLAVSGLHVAYILLIFLFVFGRFSLISRNILTIVGLFVFIFITGSTASVVRSAIMGMVILVAIITNRSANIYNSLAFSATIILFFNPGDLFDPGLQLSFAAVISIVALAPFFKRRIDSLNLKKNWIRKLLLFCTVSLAAQIGTIPFTLIYFRKLSLISLLANIVVIPFTGAMISLGILTLFLSVIWFKGALIFAAVNNLSTYLLYEINHRLSAFSFSHLSITQFSLLDAFIFYSIILLFFFYYERFQSIKPKIILFILSSVLIIFLTSLDDKNWLTENKLSICAIDIGQGDSFLIKFPNGQTALIDAGEATWYFDNGKRIIIPLLQFMDINKIDAAFISHMDTDHYSGFVSLIQNGLIRKIFKPTLSAENGADKRFEEFLKENKIPFEYYKKEKLQIGNCSLYILNDEAADSNSSISMNDRSGVMKLVYGNTSFLFTGDAGIKREKLLMEDYPNFIHSNVLKLAHHGSKTSSSEKFIKAVNPDYAIISAGQNNKFNHPSPIILERLNSASIKQLRTDISGFILMQSDGNSIKILEWRE